MAPVPYGLLMIVRLALDLLVVAGILAIWQRRITQFLLSGPAVTRKTLVGFAIGFVVMVGAITSILLSAGARVSLSHQPAVFALPSAVAWLVFGFAGAAGEELAGRVTVLLVAQPLIGRRGAILASGVLLPASPEQSRRHERLVSETLAATLRNRSWKRGYGRK